MDTNSIRTPSADSGFVLNFEFIDVELYRGYQ